MGHTTIISKQMKKWSKYFVTQVQLLEKENKTLKLKILKLTQELEKKEKNENIVYFCAKCQEGQTRANEKSGMSGSDLPLPSEDVKSPLDEVHVEEEPVHVFIPGNLQTQTSYLDDDIEIDIKEEDVDFKHSDIPIKHEIEKSIQRMFRSEAQVPNNETTREEVSTEVETELDLNHYSSSRTINVLSVKSFIPQPQVSNQRLCGQKKKPCLTTRTAEKIHKCENCPASFDTRFKLMVHNKSHTGEKQSRRNHKTSFRCVICKKSFTTKIILTDHLRTHTRQKLFRITLRTPCGKSYKTEKLLTDHVRTIHTRSLRSSSSNNRFAANCKRSLPVKKANPGRRRRTHTGVKDKSSRSLQVHKDFLAKRSLTIENQKVNPGGRSKKLRRGDTEGKVSIAEEIAGVEEIDPPCVVETNPLKIDKILGLILSNLVKHDLLNARRVSHAWNEESLKVLRKSKFTQLLREEMIKEYILFITSTEPRPFIIPFHLNFEISSGFLGLRTLKCVQCLCQRFGPECVSTLTIHSCVNVPTKVNIRDGGLIDLLTLISPGLKTLNFTRLNFEIDFLQNQIIKFPNLKKLICNTRQCISGRTGPGLSYISIIENSSLLEDLTLTHPCDLDSWPLKLNQLKSLTMDTMLNLHNILDKILTSSGPPVLRDLSFRDLVSWTVEDKLLLFNILESVSSTLKSLTVRGHLPLFHHGFSRMMKFPILPYLVHLGLEYDVANGNTYSPKPEDINLCPETFPSLESIELPIGFIFTPTNVELQEDADVRIEFPNLIKLILRVNGKAELLNEPLEQLQQIFPTPSKLCLVNGGGDACVKDLLERILKSNWSKNIHEIGMIGFSQDYLGQVLDQFPENYDEILEQGTMRNELQNTTRRMTRMRVNCVEAVVPSDSIIILTRANQSDFIKMTNITTIKLELIDESSCDCGSSNLSSTTSIQNLTGMVKHFPKLRMIEVSELLLNLWHPEGIWREHILEFKSKYPHVVLNVT